MTTETEQLYTVYVWVRGESQKEAWDLPCYATSPEAAAARVRKGYRVPVRVEKVLDAAGRHLYGEPIDE